MYTSLFSLAPYLNWQPTSPHPQTVGIRHMLMSQGLQHSGCGMASLPAHTSHIQLDSTHSSTLSLPTPTSDKPLGPSCLQTLEWVMYLGSRALQPKTIKSYITHLRSLHIDDDLPFEACKLPQLQQMVCGLKRYMGEKGQKLKLPITS